MRYDPSKTLEAREEQILANFNKCSPRGKELNLSFLRDLWEDNTDEDKIHGLKCGERPLLEMAGIPIPPELLRKAGYDITEPESQS